MEAGWRIAMFDGRLQGSPLVSAGFAEASRDYVLGWRFEPLTGAPRTERRAYRQLADAL